MEGLSSAVGLDFDEEVLLGSAENAFGGDCPFIIVAPLVKASMTWEPMLRLYGSQVS